jgi:hypothetical protein
MADGNTSEDYSGAAIPETIYLVNNTFSGNNHGITGGANLTASNNIVANCAAIAMKNVNGNSLISYSNFWNNGQNFDNCIIDDQSLIYSNPLFIAANDYHIQNTSPCIQSGTVIGAPEIDIEYEQRGNPPDIGAYEYISNEDQGLPVEMQHYEGNYLNGNIELNWVTTGELNNLGYEIFVKNKKQNEYKYLAGYSEENSLLGLGNSPQGKQYNYIHQNVDPGMTYSYKLIQYDFSGVYTEYGPIEISTTSDKNYDNFSRPTTLLQNYPNPFNPNTRISYQLPVISNVELNIYNQLGQKVATLVNKKQNSGMYRVEWDAGNLSSGIYFYIIKTGHFQDMKKMILIK